MKQFQTVDYPKTRKPIKHLTLVTVVFVCCRLRRYMMRAVTVAIYNKFQSDCLPYYFSHVPFSLGKQIWGGPPLPKLFIITVNYLETQKAFSPHLMYERNGCHFFFSLFGFCWNHVTWPTVLYCIWTLANLSCKDLLRHLHLAILVR